MVGVQTRIRAIGRSTGLILKGSHRVATGGRNGRGRACTFLVVATAIGMVALLVVTGPTRPKIAGHRGMVYRHECCTRRYCTAQYSATLLEHSQCLLSVECQLETDAGQLGHEDFIEPLRLLGRELTLPIAYDSLAHELGVGHVKQIGQGQHFAIDHGVVLHLLEGALLRYFVRRGRTERTTDEIANHFNSASQVLTKEKTEIIDRHSQQTERTIFNSSYEMKSTWSGCVCAICQNPRTCSNQSP